MCSARGRTILVLTCKEWGGATRRHQNIMTIEWFVRKGWGGWYPRPSEHHDAGFFHCLLTATATVGPFRAPMGKGRTGLKDAHMNFSLSQSCPAQAALRGGTQEHSRLKCAYRVRVRKKTACSRNRLLDKLRWVQELSEGNARQEHSDAEVPGAPYSCTNTNTILFAIHTNRKSLT